MTLLFFSGSPRPDATTSQLLRAAAAGAPAATRVVLYEGLLALPLFAPDLDGPQAAAPPAVAALRRQLATATAVLLATPEYAYGMPGSLKNALDWLVSAGSLYGKPTGVISASPSALGGEKARSGLLLTLEALGAVVVPAASFAVPLVRTKLDGAGHVTDGALQAQLVAAVRALVAAASNPAGATA